MLAEIITIGDEILIGQIVDTNSAWMARQLNAIGVSVKQITSVSDNQQHILDTLSQAEMRADIILITGGLGPTKDDITKVTLAKYFGMGFRTDEASLLEIKTIFERFNKPLLDVNIQQASVPDGCEVIVNKNGTAPCMWFEKGNKTFVSMPGVPFEMMYLMEGDILPKIKQRFNLPFVLHKTILTAGIGESFLAKEIEDIEDALPEYIKLAYLPKLGQLRLRLSATGEDQERLSSEIDFFANKIKDRIGKFYIAGEDIPLEKVLLNLMEEKGLTFSTAESCTGGYISHLVTQHPGSSVAFWGGAVSYDCSLKESILGVNHTTLAKFGAVSEETAREMVEGALKHFKTDYAVAVTGVAGPGGGSEEKPVGTVWIAVANKNVTKAKRFNFSKKRLQNIEYTAISALTMLLNLLKEETLHE